MEKHTLRRQAEALLDERFEGLDPESADNESSETYRERLRLLLHEMRVYEAELEIQNQELRNAQVELEKSRDRYADLFDFSPLGYAILDERGVILEINLTAATLLERTRGLLVGFPLIHFVATMDRPLFLNHLQRCRAGREEAVTTELRIVAGKALERPVELHSVAEAGGSGRYRTALSCIARRKEAEAALLRARDELERRVAARTAELETANRALRAEIGERERLERELRRRMEDLAEADRQKDEFLAMLAHELRNPLGAIVNAGEILRRKVANEGDVLVWVARVIKDQSMHLKRLLDDLLDVARITRGKIVLRREVVELAGIVHQALETSRPLFEAHGHRCALQMTDLTVWIEADPTRCVQIITNLLHNATKFTEPGGRIELTAACEDAQAVIRVKDSGIGIAPELLKRIFEPFTQEDRSLARSTGGLGIGLALARKLTEMHGGSIEAASPGPGQGSEFVVRLPVATPERRPDGCASASELHSA